MDVVIVTEIEISGYRALCWEEMEALWVKPVFPVFPLPLSVFLYSSPILLLCLILICVTKWLYMMLVHVCVNLEHLRLYSREANINYNLLNIFLLYGLSRHLLLLQQCSIFFFIYFCSKCSLWFSCSLSFSNVKFLGTCFVKNGTYSVYVSVWEEQRLPKGLL